MNVAVAPVLSENALRTASKFFCSSFDQTAATSTFFPASGLLEVFEVLWPHAASTETRTVTENMRPNLEPFIAPPPCLLGLPPKIRFDSSRRVYIRQTRGRRRLAAANPF